MQAPATVIQHQPALQINGTFPQVQPQQQQQQYGFVNSSYQQPQQQVVNFHSPVQQTYQQLNSFQLPQQPVEIVEQPPQNYTNAMASNDIINQVNNPMTSSTQKCNH